MLPSGEARSDKTATGAPLRCRLRSVSVKVGSWLSGSGHVKRRVAPGMVGGLQHSVPQLLPLVQVRCRRTAGRGILFDSSWPRGASV